MKNKKIEYLFPRLTLKMYLLRVQAHEKSAFCLPAKGAFFNPSRRYGGLAYNQRAACGALYVIALE